MDGLIMTQNNPLLSIVRQRLTLLGCYIIGMIAVVGVGVWMRESGGGEVSGQLHAVTVDVVTLSIGHSVPRQLHLMRQAVDMSDEMAGRRNMVERAVGEAHAVAPHADVVNGALPVDGLSVGQEDLWVGVLAELRPVALGAEVGLVQIARIVHIAVGTKEIDLVEDIDAIPSSVAVVTCVNAIDQQSSVGHIRVEDVIMVAVFQKKGLVGVEGYPVCIAAVALPRNSFQLIRTVGIDLRYVVDPIAVFVFDVAALMLWWLCRAAHQVPRPHRVDAAIVVIEVGSAQRMAHLVAKRADIEIAALLQLQVEVKHLQVFQRHITVVDAPAVRP